jgi:anti-sigma B factor antagonist
MFAITLDDKGTILLEGRLDASQVEAASKVLDAVNETSKVDFTHLEYISSAGLGLLLKTQKRLSGAGKNLVLTGMNKMVRDVFRIARFDLIFAIEES